MAALHLVLDTHSPTRARFDHLPRGMYQATVDFNDLEFAGDDEIRETAHKLANLLLAAMPKDGA